MIRNNQRQYLVKCIVEKYPPRVLWSRIDGLGLTQRSRTACAPMHSSVEVLNNHFVTMGTPTDQLRVSSMQECAVLDMHALNNPLRNNVLFFRFALVTPEMVSKALPHVTSSAIGIDDQSVRLYKCFGKLLWYVIAMIFNSSLSRGTFPELWKRAIVRSLGEVTGAARPEDFRPISLLPYLSKVLENVVLDQVVP